LSVAKPKPREWTPPAAEEKKTETRAAKGKKNKQ
jgi:hypothetical protein